MAARADDLADRGDLGGRSGQEDLVGLAELLRHDRPLDDLDAALARQSDDGLPGEAVEEAIRRWGVQFAVDDEKDVGAGALGQLAAPVEHQRVVATLRLSLVL